MNCDLDAAKRHLTRRNASAPVRAASNDTGAEKQIANEALRLIGRVDLLEFEDGEVVIRDLKTGNVRDSTGAIAEHIAFQMRPYGLLATKTFPGKRVRLVVEHQQSEELTFTVDDIERTEEQRREIMERTIAWQGERRKPRYRRRTLSLVRCAAPLPQLPCGGSEPLARVTN
jgi:hypothetical protein